MTNIIATANDAAGQEFLRGFAEISAEHDRKLVAICADLRRQDIKALHPHDGWIKRLGNGVIQFKLVYPRFRTKMEFEAGDKVAFIGVADEVSIYTVTNKVEKFFSHDWWQAVEDDESSD